VGVLERESRSSHLQGQATEAVGCSGWVVKRLSQLSLNHPITYKSASLPLLLVQLRAYSSQTKSKARVLMDCAYHWSITPPKKRGNHINSANSTRRASVQPLLSPAWRDILKKTSTAGFLCKHKLPYTTLNSFFRFSQLWVCSIFLLLMYFNFACLVLDNKKKSDTITHQTIKDD